MEEEATHGRVHRTAGSLHETRKHGRPRRCMQHLEACLKPRVRWAHNFLAVRAGFEHTPCAGPVPDSMSLRAEEVAPSIRRGDAHRVELLHCLLRHACDGTGEQGLWDEREGVGLAGGCGEDGSKGADGGAADPRADVAALVGRVVLQCGG